MRAAAFVTSVAAATFCLAPASSRAEGTYEGTWQAAPMRVKVVVQSWGPDCGPRPPAISSEPGGTVRIEQSGSDLRLSGAMSWQTDRCFTPNRSAHLQSSSSGDGSWRVTCRTGPDDPKGEQGSYGLRASGPDHLTFHEESRYDWQLKQSRCVATRVADRTLTREAQPAAVATGHRATSEAACKPGAPAKLVLSPERKVIEPGERLCFYARLLDAAGCPVEGADIRYGLEGAGGGRGQMHGQCFEAGTEPGAEHTIVVTAASGRLRDHATVTVRSADLSDLIARGSLAPAGGQLGRRQPATAAQAPEVARVAARASARQSAVPWPILAAGAAVLLLIGVTVVLMLQRRHRQAPPLRTVTASGHGEPPEATHPAGGGSMPVASVRPPAAAALRCPVCHGEYPPETLFCPADGARLDEAKDSGPPRQAMICPTCRRGYAPEARFCPRDSDELMPYAAFVNRQKQEQSLSGEQGRICPKCGERYGSDVAFCGKDGSELVLVN